MYNKYKVIYMIHPTTLTGAKDVLSQYIGDEYYIIYDTLKGTAAYWLVEVMDVEGCIVHNEHSEFMRNYKHPSWEFWDSRSPSAIARIPKFIMIDLINEGFVVRSMSDKEWRVQIALGTAPAYRPYLISGDII